MIEVFDEAGARLVLRGPGRSGGEGTVYGIDGTAVHVAKIYHPGRATAELHEKIRAMAAAQPDDPAWSSRRHRSIAWVERVLYHDAARTDFAGFVMPAVDPVFAEAHRSYDPADRVARFGGAYTWRHLLTAATNLASSVAAIHDEGHRVGDLRETNVLVGPNALITLIDCDSFQIRDRSSGRVFHTRVGTADYLPPELQGADFRRDHDRTHADGFALGVLLFRFLMEGVHPYQAVGRAVDGAPSTEAKIRKGLFPYARRARVEPPPFAPPFEILPPSLRALFVRCFVEGHRHPKRRPTPAEWFAALSAEAKRARRCKANPHHAFGRHLRQCPWCRIARERGVDPYPAPGAKPGKVGVQVAVSPPRASQPQTSAPNGTARPRRLRLTKRRAQAIGAIAAVLGALASPIGHASSAPRSTEVLFRARAAAPCPFEAAVRPEPDPACAGAWTVGPVTMVEQHHRRMFVVRDVEERMRVEYVVRYARDGGCEIPWLDHLSFNARAQQLCLSSCAERIEVRDASGARGRLIAVTGVGARDEPLRCGVRYRGSWTFDVAGLAGPLRLHFPGLDGLRIPRAR